MKLDHVVATVLLGVLAYKSLELAVSWEKLQQAVFRGRRARLFEDGLVKARITRVIAWLHEEFATIVMSYLMIMAVVLGMYYLLAPSILVVGSQTLTSSLAVTVTTIVSSVCLALLNVFIERFRTDLDRNS